MNEGPVVPTWEDRISARQSADLIILGYLTEDVLVSPRIETDKRRVTTHVLREILIKLLSVGEPRRANLGYPLQIGIEVVRVTPVT